MAICTLIQDLENKRLAVGCPAHRYRKADRVPVPIPLAAETKLGEGGMGAVYGGFNEVVKMDHLLQVRQFRVSDLLPVHVDYHHQDRALFISLPDGTSSSCFPDEKAMIAIDRSVREHRMSRYCTFRGVVQHHGQGYYLFPNPLAPDESILWSGLFLNYVEGHSLDELIAAKALQPSEILCIAHDLAQVVTSLREHNVYHRDLKPGNIVISLDGPILLDLGAAKLMSGVSYPSFADDTPDVGLLQQGQWSEKVLMGTPHYWPPEIIEGIQHPNGDLFSLGIIIYEMFTGKYLFEEKPLRNAYPFRYHDEFYQGTLRRVETDLVGSGCPRNIASEVAYKLLRRDPEGRDLTSLAESLKLHTSRRSDVYTRLVNRPYTPASPDHRALEETLDLGIAFAECSEVGGPLSETNPNKIIPTGEDTTLELS